MRPVIDAIYGQQWPGCTISRFERDDDLILDKKHAIDVKVSLPCGMILLGQEKALRHHYAKFGTVTVEYHNNPLTQEPGDWFHLASQFYFCGYATEDRDGFTSWVLLNWPKVVQATHEKRLTWSGPRDNSKTSARASFKHIKMGQIPSECVMASHGVHFAPPLQPVKSARQQVKELITDMTLAELRDIIGEVLTEQIRTNKAA